MSIVRGRDVKFAKRRIPELEKEIYNTEIRIDGLQGELNAMEAELSNLQELVEEHEEAPAIRASQKVRPEARLSQFVSA